MGRLRRERAAAEQRPGQKSSGGRQARPSGAPPLDLGMSGTWDSLVPGRWRVSPFLCPRPCGSTALKLFESFIPFPSGPHSQTRRVFIPSFPVPVHQQTDGGPSFNARLDPAFFFSHCASFTTSRQRAQRAFLPKAFSSFCARSIFSPLTFKTRRSLRDLLAIVTSEALLSCVPAPAPH